MSEDKKFEPKGEDVIRQEVVTEFAFDEELDKDRIDKLVSERVEHQNELSTAIGQKAKYRTNYTELETKLKDAGINLVDDKVVLPEAKGTSSLDVEDFIGISTSLEGLDSREKEYIARQHKLSGLPISDLRKSEDFSLWQSAYRTKVEKEKQTLTPSTTQPESDKPKTLMEKLRGATLKEQEELLKSAGLYKESKPKLDRVNIGAAR